MFSWGSYAEVFIGPKKAIACLVGVLTVRFLSDLKKLKNWF